MLRALAARPQQPPAGRVGAFAQHRVRVACAARPVLSAGRPLEQAFFRAARRRGAARVVARAAALTEQELAKRALRLDAFDDRAVEQALAQLRAALGADADVCDADTSEWLLRDRKLDVEKAAAKVRAYAAWRATGFSGLTANDVAREAATGKARLLAQRDMLGRPVVLVKVSLNRVDQRELAETERLCVYLMDEALAQMKAEGRVQTILTIFDLRGFTTQNADIPFIRFFIKLMFDIYPKRIGQVLLVGAPLIFQPVWQVVKPLLGKYAALVQFVSAQEGEAYFGSAGGRVLDT